MQRECWQLLKPPFRIRKKGRNATVGRTERRPAQARYPNSHGVSHSGHSFGRSRHAAVAVVPSVGSQAISTSARTRHDAGFDLGEGGRSRMAGSWSWPIVDRLEEIASQIPAGRPSVLIGEPVGRNTAAAVAAAALLASPDEVLLVLPADHHIADVAEFHRALDTAVAVAGQGRLVTFGVVPTRLETGFGYIIPGESAVGSDHRCAFHRAFRRKARVLRPQPISSRLAAFGIAGCLCSR